MTKKTAPSEPAPPPKEAPQTIADPSGVYIRVPVGADLAAQVQKWSDLGMTIFGLVTETVDAATKLGGATSRAVDEGKKDLVRIRRAKARRSRGRHR